MLLVSEFKFQSVAQLIRNTIWYRDRSMICLQLLRRFLIKFINCTSMKTIPPKNKEKELKRMKMIDKIIEIMKLKK